MKELISIVVPVYNCEKFIDATINSVKNQTYDNWELILVDDGSKDSTTTIISSYEDSRIIPVIGVTNAGAYAARNEGIKRAKGRYLAFLDADDIWDNQKLEKTLDFLNEKDASFVFTGYEFGDSNGVGTGKIVHVPDSIDYSKALSRTVIFTSTTMFDLNRISKELVMMPGVKSEDTATWWKILRTGIVAYGLDESLVIYRRNAGTLSSNKLEAVRRIWNLYRNVEHLSLAKSAICFVGWAFRAVARRI